MKRIKKNEEIHRWWKRRNNSLTTYHLSTEKIYHGALFTLHLLTYIGVHISDDVVEGRDGEHTIGSIRYKLCRLYALSRITSCCHFVMLMIRWKSTIDLTLRWNNSEHKTASSSSTITDLKYRIHLIPITTNGISAQYNTNTITHIAHNDVKSIISPKPSRSIKINEN